MKRKTCLSLLFENDRKGLIDIVFVIQSSADLKTESLVTCDVTEKKTKLDDSMQRLIRSVDKKYSLRYALLTGAEIDAPNQKEENNMTLSMAFRIECVRQIRFITTKSCSIKISNYTTAFSCGSVFSWHRSILFWMRQLTNQI